MFNIREFIIKNLIDGVKNKSFTKEYASILAVNYLVKGILTQEDLSRFNEEVIILEEDKQEVIEETTQYVAEEIPEETEENIEETEQPNPTEEIEEQLETTEEPTEEVE
jgi:polyhydroxyalkanoate synthesis regulator phasin